MTTVVNCQFDEYDIYCGRGSKWGNPYTHIKDKQTKAIFIVKTRKEAIEKYREYILNRPDLLQDLIELKDKRLGCYCKPKHSCHCDILVELIEKIFDEKPKSIPLFKF
jgi:hypothetical protein